MLFHQLTNLLPFSAHQTHLFPTGNQCCFLHVMPQFPLSLLSSYVQTTFLLKHKILIHYPFLLKTQPSRYSLLSNISLWEEGLLSEGYKVLIDKVIVTMEELLHSLHSIPLAIPHPVMPALLLYTFLPMITIKSAYHELSIP